MIAVVSTVVPRDVHVLISEICEQIALHGKWNFACVIKLRVLR